MIKVFKFLSHHKISLLIITLFLITRAYIWFNPPINFTEIIYSYMPYAHLWASGVRPYLDQWYEYPPVTIPLFYLPHIIDQATYGSFWHINYLQVYRSLLFLIDISIFYVLWQSIIRLGIKSKFRLISLSYYCLLTALASHFIYDTMDWVFAGALVLSVAPPLWTHSGIKTKINSTIASFQNWLGFWLAVGLKLLNGPLGLPLILLQRKKWPIQWLMLILTGGIIWGLPLLLFRSSLSVMFVYHQIRGLQVDSFMAIIVRIMNGFSNSESVIEVYKNYEMAGPISSMALRFLSWFFPLAIILFVGWTSKQAWQIATRKKDHQVFRLSITLGFVFLLMIISKVLSHPFVLWHIPLLAMLPYFNFKQQLKFIIPSIIAVSVTVIAVPDIPIGIISTATLVGIIRSLVFFWLLIEWFKWHRWRFNSKSLLP